MEKILTINDVDYKVPNHVAIIMDGNGRWAKSKNMPRSFGHAQGSDNLEKLCKQAYDLGINYMTVYAFSTENWKRPEDEINILMKLLRKYLKTSIKKSIKNNIKIKIIGDISPLDDDLISKIELLERETENLSGLYLQIALNYGSQNEIIRAIKKMYNKCQDESIDINCIYEKFFEQFLDTYDVPVPDLLIRTSGEQRLSNFLLWQMAYTEFYFTDKYWPEFSKNDLIDAIKYYNKRERRFGGIKSEDKR